MFLWKPPFIADFPACHVWLPKGIHDLSMILIIHEPGVPFLSTTFSKQKGTWTLHTWPSQHWEARWSSLILGVYPEAIRCVKRQYTSVHSVGLAYSTGLAKPIWFSSFVFILSEIAIDSRFFFSTLQRPGSVRPLHPEDFMEINVWTLKLNPWWMSRNLCTSTTDP